jgi:hypothetical protein
VSTEAEPAVSRLPSWFDGNRVQGHTRLALGKYEPPRPRFWYGTEQFKHAGAGFKALGARAFTRHVKSRDEDPWWPTAVPISDDGRANSVWPRDINGVLLGPEENAAQAIIEEAHAAGLKIIAYYFDAVEATLAACHPDWVCRTAKSKIPIPERRGVPLDLTGPAYREIVLTRLLELAEMGADGFYFDHLHLPREGAWHSALEAAWVAETGDAEPPFPPDRKAVPSAKYLEFLDFRARKIEETFTYWRVKVKERHPNVVFVISIDDFAPLMNRGVTTRLVRIADSAKNEYCQALRDKIIGPFETVEQFFEKNKSVLVPPPGHVRQSLAWTVLRDSSDGRPPHIWHPGVPSDDQAEAYAASLLTFGAIAAMDTWEGSLLTDRDQRGQTPVAGLKRAFDLGNIVSPHLARSQPLRWAAVHFGERSRNARGGDYLAMWQQVLWPLLGPYKVLSEDGLPVTTIDDDQLERGELTGYRLLVLPNPNELTPAQQDAITAFKAHGGVVIENDPAWAWSDPSGTDAAAAAFRAAVHPYLHSAPVTVTGGPPGRYAVSYRKPGQLLVALTNDFGWIQFETASKPIPRDQISQQPPPVEGVQITWKAGPEPPQATEVVNRLALPVLEINGGHRVDLPSFQYMALLIVTQQA